MENKYSKEEIEAELEEWARFLYKLYKTRKNIVKLVLEDKINEKQR